MISNAKMDYESAIDLLMSIIQSESTSDGYRDVNDDLDTTLNDFINSYIKLKKHIAIYRDNIEKEHVLEKLLDDIINKIEDDSYMKPVMIKKIKEIRSKDVYKVKLC